MQGSYGYSQSTDYNNTQPFNINGEYQYSESYEPTCFDFQTTPDSMNFHPTSDVHTSIESWEQLLGVETTPSDHSYQDISSADLTASQTVHFQSNQQDDHYRLINNKDSSIEEINADMDYETIIRTKNLYNDPQPQIIRKSINTNPVVYNQRVTIRFLQPPPIEQGPLIIREVRPPQPPLQPPLIIRQRPVPARSPSPLILREKPPAIPDHTAPQVVTKTLPPVPPPPRTVVVEKIPPLPPKPRDIIIERWIPYESLQKRKVIVQRAEESKSYAPPKNVIIVYEPIQPRVVRQYERMGVKSEDPNKYAAMFGNTLISTEQLLLQIKELGISVDLSPPHIDNLASTRMNYERSNNGQHFHRDSEYYLNNMQDPLNPIGSYGITTPIVTN